jgi:very-short-patch-repair endonuclease
LRKQPTKAEDVLWQRLRRSRFHGAKFRRQIPFDRFVVDFYCHAAKLVVEWFADYDAGRTTVFESRGVSVIRFAKIEVENDLDSVLARIRVALRLPFDEARDPLTPAPPAGEGSAARVRRTGIAMLRASGPY